MVTVAKMTLRNQARLGAIVLVTLLVATVFTVDSIHASTTSWTVSIDADSTGPTDADVQSSHNIFGLTTVTVGAVVNASAAQPISNILGWQFAIIYENTSLTLGQVQYGAQTGGGNPDWAGKVAGGTGFGIHNNVASVNVTACGCDPATHAEILVGFTVLNSSPVTIGPALSPTVQGNLLATVSFTVTNPSLVGAKFTPTYILFVDNNSNPLPDIHPGPTITNPAAWTVALDANSRGPTDAEVQTTNTVRNSATVGAVIDASNNYPLNNVTGWQFSITYDSSSLAPILVVYGAQTGLGNPDWTGQIASSNARSYNSTISVDSTHRKILVNFTLVNPNPPLTISPYLDPTVQGNLLASVNFTILKNATSPLTLSIGDVAFYDNSTQRKPISHIVAGAPVTETIGVPTPPTSPINIVYILLGVVAAIIAALVVIIVRRGRRGKTSASNSKNRNAPVRVL